MEDRDLTVTVLQGLRGDLNQLRQDVRSDIGDVRTDIKELSSKVVTADACKACKENWVDKREFRGAVRLLTGAGFLLALTAKWNDLVEWVRSILH